MTSLPQHCPTPRELDDLELLLSGALAPRVNFDATGSFRIDLPTNLATHHANGGSIELVDPEGLPLAEYSRHDLSARKRPAYGAFRRLRLTPAAANERYPRATWVTVDRPLSQADLATLHDQRDQGPLVLLTLAGTGRARSITDLGLIRATMAAARELTNCEVVVVPLASHHDGDLDARLSEAVVANYARGRTVLRLPPTATGPLPSAVQEIVDADQPLRPGAVIFFTGLSGSGKSTLARALVDRILESGSRTVTSLDGDVVRRQLSAGLTFSKEDRETNLMRIGWVAAEIARHRGVAICSPIAPFDATRAAIRSMVEAAGGQFVLIHVATSLEECERRDRKGLYAKARRGEIADFTGISSPYEIPADAEIVADTAGVSVDDVSEFIWSQLEARGLTR